jgi:hypothetical protein
MKNFTVAFYLQALVPHAMPREGIVSALQVMFSSSPGLWASLFWLAVIWAVFLGLGTRVVERREYVLEQ